MGDDEAELGLGIHGEPGFERIDLREIAAIVATMTDRLARTLPDGDADHALIPKNLGAVPPIGMGVVANEVLRFALGPRVRLLLGPGPYMAALNMNGFSLSPLKLDAAREVALTAPVGPAAEAPAASESPALAAAIRSACDRLIALEDSLNWLDARAGDGDTGSTAATGARSLVAALPGLPLADPAATCRRIGDLLATSMGGSSGVLLSIFFTAAG